MVLDGNIWRNFLAVLASAKMEPENDTSNLNPVRRQLTTDNRFDSRALSCEGLKRMGLCDE